MDDKARETGVGGVGWFLNKEGEGGRQVERDKRRESSGERGRDQKARI
jgi:hypothetical protein